METTNQTAETTSQAAENNSLTYLRNALEYNGFGALSAKLADNINHQRDRFTLYASDREPDARGQSLKYELNFSSKDGEKYYWNTTKATLSSPDPLKNGREHTFFAGMYSPNQDQMKALLNGASLYRNKLQNSDTKQTYSAWQKIHFNDQPDRYGNHPLKQYYDNNGPRIDGALAKWNDVVSMTNAQRAVAVEQWKRGEPAVVHVAVKEGNVMKQEKAVAFFDAQYKDLLIVRQSGEVLERDYNKKRAENIMVVDTPSREPSQGNAAPASDNGGVNTGQSSGSEKSKFVEQGTPGSDNKQITNTSLSESSSAANGLQADQGTKSKDEVKNAKPEAPELTSQDRQQKSEKKGLKPGR